VVVVDLLRYQIVVASGALGRVGEIARQHAPAHRYAIITDDTVGPLYAAAVRRALGDAQTSVHSIPAGEAHKTRESWATLTDAMLADGCGRDTTVVALGGGVIGDLAGFVAATYMRGVPFIQIPTSLLAMIDASIGGKTGVDTPTGKNLVGAFHQPAAVIADPDVLRTLPAAHRRAGLAEAIKHGAIADAAYFDRVVTQASNIDRPDVDLSELVAGSVRIKASVVANDEREHGQRKILNFGHTLGHAIESASDYTLLHGEAIAIGMVLEAKLAERIEVAEAGTADRIVMAVDRARLPKSIPPELDRELIHQLTRSDKKARGGRVEYALPARIGAMAGGDRGWGIAVEDEAVLSVISQG
jgi:3-dehydroquinate synthase